MYSQTIFITHKGKQDMKKSVPSISIPVVYINLHCSGEITNKSNLAASQYPKSSARQPEFSGKVREWWKPAESTEPVQNNTSVGPETTGIILTATETQLLDSTPHGTAGLMSRLNTSKLKPEENLSRCNKTKTLSCQKDFYQNVKHYWHVDDKNTKMLAHLRIQSFHL